MKEPIVITDLEYAKGEVVFGEASGKYEWLVVPGGEEEVAAAVAASGARAAVLGVRRYSGPLYEALAANAKGGESLIVRYGVGYDGIDLAMCRRHGTRLAITAGALDRSVAEQTVALMLACARNLPYLDATMRSGGFSSRQGFELYGKTLGLIGLGRIGKHVARIAAFGFGMRVEACDVLSLEEAAAREGSDGPGFLARYGLSGYGNSYEEVARQADILSLHMPVLPSTLRFMDSRRFACMKRGALFVNTDRGRLVDEAELYGALVSGQLCGAGLDVYEREPYEPVSPDLDLRKLPNVVLSSHVASNTREANAAMQRMVMQNLDAWFSGRTGSLTLVPIP